MKRRTSRWKILVPLAAALLAMTVAFILISYVSFRNFEIQDLENYARGLTKLIADEIVDEDQIDAFLEQGRSHPEYDVAEKKLYKLREAYPDIIYLYVYQIREDGCHVVFDLSTDQFAGSEPGTVEAFFPAYEKYIPDLLAGKEVPSIESQEKYGHVLTVMRPLYDSDGICRGYVGADCSMEALDVYVRNVVGQAGLFFLAILVITLTVSLFAADRGVVRKMSSLEDRAYVDTLTGLQNRTAFYEYSAALNKKQETGDADFSILMIDINFLKRVNDTYGHEQGNLYLRRAADLIRKHFGDENLYRIGGDEFVKILEGKAQEGAEEHIRAFREETGRLQADDSLKPWERVSAAVGIARYDRNIHLETEEVLRKADEAMYADKTAMKAARTV